MKPMSLRRSLRQYATHLNRAQRRAWMIQRLERSPRVSISAGYLVPAIARTYAYCKVA